MPWYTSERTFMFLRVEETQVRFLALRYRFQEGLLLTYRKWVLEKAKGRMCMGEMQVRGYLCASSPHPQLQFLPYCPNGFAGAQKKNETRLVCVNLKLLSDDNKKREASRFSLQKRQF